MDKINHPTQSLVLLKLGGSLITDKEIPRSLRLDTLHRLADEIASALQQKPSLRLIIGHGAGSFAHVSAKKHGTRNGVSTRDQWRGFAEVWWDAATLNRLVITALHEAGLPAIALPPSASVTAKNGLVARWDLGPLEAALEAGLLPIIYGDVVFDLQRGGTILSTEDLFTHLVRQFQPARMLLAGIEPGVWKDFPNRSQVFPKITPENYQEVLSVVGVSAATDVTGGMESKVEQSIALINEFPNLGILIFSGDEPKTLQNVLLGSRSGTVICSEDKKPS
jgi:isopentenyl phosphate kinase